MRADDRQRSKHRMHDDVQAWVLSTEKGQSHSTSAPTSTPGPRFGFLNIIFQEKVLGLLPEVTESRAEARKI